MNTEIPQTKWPVWPEHEKRTKNEYPTNTRVENPTKQLHVHRKAIELATRIAATRAYQLIDSRVVPTGSEEQLAAARDLDKRLADSIVMQHIMSANVSPMDRAEMIMATHGLTLNDAMNME